MDDLTGVLASSAWCQKSTWEFHPHPAAPVTPISMGEILNDNSRQSANVHPMDLMRLEASVSALSANLAADIRQCGLPALIHSTAASEYKRGVVSILFVDR